MLNLNGVGVTTQKSNVLEGNVLVVPQQVEGKRVRFQIGREVAQITREGVPSAGVLGLRSSPLTLRVVYQVLVAAHLRSELDCHVAFACQDRRLD